jgi:hypothetical protein
VKRILLLLIINASALSAQMRTIDTIFPSLDADIKKKLAAERIYVNSEALAGFRVIPSLSAELPSLMPQKGTYKYLIETLIYIPEAKNKNITHIYNALKDLDTLQGRTYYSTTRKKNTMLFLEAVRIVSDTNFRIMPDNIPTVFMPDSEVRFMRLKDVNFGNCYYRADVKKNGNGIQFSLTNFKTINFIFVPVIKNNDLFINYYIEPLPEGVMFYGLIAVKAASYIDDIVDVPQAIIKRIGVINEWIIDGLR